MEKEEIETRLKNNELCRKETELFLKKAEKIPKKEIEKAKRIKELMNLESKIRDKKKLLDFLRDDTKRLNQLKKEIKQ